MSKTKADQKGLRILLWIVVALVFVTLAAGAVLVWKFRHRAPHDERLYHRGVLLMRSNQTLEAVAAFRKSIQINPKNYSAWVGLAETLALRKDFDSAAEAISSAEKQGLDAKQALSLRTNLLIAQAGHHMKSAGQSYTEADCEKIITENINPALKNFVQLAKQEADEPKTKKPGDTLRRLGDILRFKADILTRQRFKVEENRQNAVKLHRRQQAEELRVTTMELTAQINTAVLRSRMAYAKAVELQPELSEARIALARQYLLGSVPNAAKGKLVLQPILEQHPEHPEALYLLGIAEHTLGNTDKALAHLRKIAPDATNYEFAQIYEADILIEAEHFDEAAPITEKLHARNPRDPRIAYAHARVLLHRGDVEKATPLLQNIFSSEKMLWPEARHELAKTLMRTGNRQQGLQAWRDTVADVDALLPRAGIKRQAWLEIKYTACSTLARELHSTIADEAKQYAQMALMLFPDRKEACELVKKTFLKTDPKADIDWAIFLHATSLFRLRKYDDAMSIIQAERSIIRDKTRADRFLAAGLAGKGAFTEAVKCYEELLKDNPADTTFLRLELARLYRYLGRNDDAVSIYRTVIKDEPQNVNIIVRLAALLASLKRTDEAKTLLKNAAVGGIKAQALIGALLQVYIREKNLDAAIALVDTQIQEQPDETEWLIVKARLLWANGDRAAARKNYDTALNLNEPPVGAYRRVLLDLAEGKYEQARALAEKALKADPELRIFQVYRAIAWQATDPKQTLATLVEAMKDARLHPKIKQSVHLMWAITQAGEGQLEQAPETDEQKLATERKDLTRFLRILNTLEPQTRRQAALAFNIMVLMLSLPALDDAKTQADLIEALLPGEPFPICEKARLLAVSGAPEEALSEYNRVIKNHPDYITAWFNKAQTLVTLDKHDDAIAVLEELLKKDITDDDRTRIALQLSAQYRRAERYDMAIAHLKAAAQNPRFAPIAYNDLAWVIATRQNNPKAALPYALQAVAKSPDTANIQDTIGWIYLLNDQPADAVAHLQKAANLNPRNPVIRYHLGIACAKTGKTQQALSELRQALALGSGLSAQEASDAARLIKTLSPDSP